MTRARVTLLGMLAVAAATTAACRGAAGPPAGLQATADSLLPRLETLAGLEARAPVAVEVQSREALRAYVVEQMEEELPPDELAGVEAAYAAFGLIPDTLDLYTLLLDLYTEQVVGYYDTDTEALYLVEGVPDDELLPVMAHELVHALQDQHVDLDSLIARERGNDRQTAAQAAIEGHATLVMFAWLFEEQSGAEITADRLPDMSSQLEPLLEAQNEQFPVFRSAPRVIRETLLFPYVRGAAFVQALWRTAPEGAQGMAAHPPPLGENLPQSTEQVRDPASRFFGGRDAPTEIVFRPAMTSADAGGAASVLYENTLGELETRILLEEHLGRENAEPATGWDGDRYRAFAMQGGGTAIVWYSIWDTEADADRFAEAYRRILDARTERHGSVERLAIAGRPAVRVVDAPEAAPLDVVPAVVVEGLATAASP